MESDGRTWSRGPMIGKGAFGCVYLGTAKKPNSRCGFHPHVMAVKSADISNSASLQKEKEVLFNLSQCPNVLRCFGEDTTVGHDGTMAYNVFLEYAPGGTLARLIKNSPDGAGLPESEVRRYTKCLLGGIRQVHEHGYVHCDLKPDNVLLVPSKPTSAAASKFLPKIGDFGLAKRAKQTKKQKLDPYLRGTAMYLAPESVVDHVQEPPSDIWALGCIVFEMLTGKPPWDLKPDYKRDDLLCLIRDPLQLPKIPTEISKEARHFLKGCFVRNPKFRLTADMLLDHPFVASEYYEFGDLQVGEGLSETAGFSTPCSSSESNDGSDSFLISECGGFSCDGDSELSSCSCLEDFGESGSFSEDMTSKSRKRKRLSNFIAITDADSLLNTKATAPLKTVHKFTVPTISAGV